MSQISHLQTMVRWSQKSRNRPVSGEVCTATKDGELKRLTRSVRTRHSPNFNLAPMEKDLQFPSNDGTPIEAFVVKPPGFNSNLRYPTLLNIHGGPVGQFSYGYSFTPQFFAAHGYLVVQPNPRGSTGHGDAFRRAIYRSWGEKGLRGRDRRG